MTVYSPREDSYLLKSYIEEKDLEGKKLLDMGTGSGIQAVTAAEKGADVSAVDINPEAVETVRRKASEQDLDIEVRESDLFENVDKKFDIIVFNPPYLPGKEGIGDEEIWRGGNTGLEVTEKFLEKVDQYLEQKGEAVFILSSETDWSYLKQDYGLEIIESRKLWFETVYLAVKR